MDNLPDGIEKRAHPRIDKRFVIRFRSHNNKDSKWAVSILNNISQSGCYFYSNILCEVGQLLDIEIQIPALDDYMHFVGEVKRVESQEVVQITKYGVGVYFQEMEEEKKKKFLEMVDSPVKQQKDK